MTEKIEINDEFIATTIEEKAERDQYGQITIFSCRLNNLFPDLTIRSKVVEYLRSGESAYSCDTYSNRYFTYKAIYPYKRKN